MGVELKIEFYPYFIDLLIFRKLLQKGEHKGKCLANVFESYAIPLLDSCLVSEINCKRSRDLLFRAPKF